MKNLFVYLNFKIVSLYLAIWKFTKAIDWKGLFGFLMVVAGVIAGLYLGVWWAFIGGIVAVIEAFKATPIEALDAAIAFARIWFSAMIGWCACLALVIPGLKLLK